MKFFCIHHSPAIDRKEYLLPFFDQNNLNINWIESFLPTEKPVIDHKDVFSEVASNRIKLNKAEISCFMKHRQGIIEIANLNDDYGVVMEDDIEIPNFDFLPTLKKFSDEFGKMSGDILFIGSMVGMDIISENSDTVFYSPHFSSRCAHCYMISGRVAKKIYPYLEDIVAPFDWQLNMIISSLNLRCCWSTPHINQRTEKGEIKSLLR